MEEETQEESNLKNLKTLAFFRTQLWQKIYELKDFDSFEVSILDSQCPGCKNFIDSDEIECHYCNFKFSEKSSRQVKKFDTPGKGKKQCQGCKFYLAVRTGICDCGYDFTNEIQTFSEKKELEISNVKKKKSCYYKIKEIKDVNLLIKNDIINNNFLGLIQFIKSKGPKKMVEYQEITDIINYIIRLRNDLCNNNYKLVTKIASKYVKRNLVHLKIKDLIQSGTIGLLKAINHYDSEFRNARCSEKSISFSTYAHWWINKSIVDDINNTEREIRIPQHILNIYKDFKNYYNTFELNHEREPSLNEIMNALGIKDKKATGLLFAKHYKSANTIGLDSLDLNGKDFNDPYSSNNTSKLNTSTKNNFKHVATELTTIIDDTLLNLKSINFEKIKYDKPIYKNIFYSLTGLFGHKELTASEAEKEYGVTKVTIARIREKTIERIKKQLIVTKKQNEIKEKELVLQKNEQITRNIQVDNSNLLYLNTIKTQSQNNIQNKNQGYFQIQNGKLGIVSFKKEDFQNNGNAQLIEEIIEETIIEETFEELDGLNLEEFEDESEEITEEVSEEIILYGEEDVKTGLYDNEDEGELYRTFKSYEDD